MKDGFDRSVAERMPKMQKRRPNRPWNVDPVLIRPQEDMKEQSAPVAEVAPKPTASNPDVSKDTSHAAIAKAVEPIEEYGRENTTLKENLAELEKATQEHTLIEREITFLNEQIEDADHYIRHVVGMLEHKNADYDSEVLKNRALEDRLERFTSEIQDKAKLDVKVSILEKDLNFSTSRIHELENQLEEEWRKRKPLEDEIAELKTALDRVYSSLSHIRLKAKREVYGS